MEKQQIGLLVMAYGTPTSLAEVETYYTHIRHGHPPTAEQLQELTARYEAIGGVSPLNEITLAQVENLQKRLNQLSVNYDFQAYAGMKHTHPFIEEAIEKMAQNGIKHVVGIVLAPHYSSMSIGAYNKTAAEAAAKHGIEISLVKNYHLEPNLISALVQRVNSVLNQFPDERRSSVKVLFTAHSLPEKILEINDPYPVQLLETADAIATKLGLSNWETGWQSAGRTTDPWMGPDILDKLKELKSKGITDVLICPIGFVSDHLEVLYDIDIECQQLAKDLGMHVLRTSSLNDDPLYTEALANSVLRQLEPEERK